MDLCPVVCGPSDGLDPEERPMKEASNPSTRIEEYRPRYLSHPCGRPFEGFIAKGRALLFTRPAKLSIDHPFAADFRTQVSYTMVAIPIPKKRK